MKFTHKTAVLGLIVVFTVTAAFAVIPHRTPSDNGADGNATQWLLQGQTAKFTIDHNGKSVVVSREIVCPNFDVEASESSPNESLAGACDSGSYMFIFQLQSGATNIDVKVTKLPPFTANDGSGGGLPNYGVVLCDPSPSSNTSELCTNNPSGSLLPDITFSVETSGTVVDFQVPSIPKFKAGTAAQGKGLTLFIVTQQATPLPINFPQLVID